MGQLNTIKLTMVKGLQFTAHDEHGHTMILDTETKIGGFDQGFRPMELLLVSLAGCMSMDIVSIVQKKGGQITSFETTIQGQRAEKHPKRFEKIIVKFICQGNYEREDLLRALELSRDKYCGVSATLRDSPDIEFSI
ncbi:OsmC family protein [candidate division WOR-3 bacterium]|nr:OsmC family protein [candidate division WOR-3 bacterium]